MGENAMSRNVSARDLESPGRRVLIYFVMSRVDAGAAAAAGAAVPVEAGASGATAGRVASAASILICHLQYSFFPVQLRS